MKCIKNVETSIIDRVSDPEARRKVNTGKWEYCSKAAWKKQKNGGQKDDAR